MLVCVVLEIKIDTEPGASVISAEDIIDVHTPIDIGDWALGLYAGRID